MRVDILIVASSRTSHHAQVSPAPVSMTDAAPVQPDFAQAPTRADKTLMRGEPRPVLRRRIVWIVACVGATVVMTLLGISYGRALAYPGEASVAVRTVDWARDHGGGPVVDVLENWWYAHHQETSTTRPPSGAPVADTPPPLQPLGSHRAPGDGEGVWEALPSGLDGGPAGYATYLRPDPDRPNVLVGVARFNQRLVRTQLVAGTREPALDPTPGHGQVPAAIRSRLVATFNSGYKILDSGGGYYVDRNLLRPLRDSAASVVIDDTGKVSVDQWGRDAQLGPHVAAVRQNLALIVDGGRPVSGLGDNRDNRWGSTGNQRQYTWRSGVGTDAAGTLYYVAGDQLTLAMLARALGATGAVRGMELDIHPNMVHLFTYRHLNGSAEPTPSKLLDAMRGPANRYLVPDRRDFFAITRR